MKNLSIIVATLFVLFISCKNTTKNENQTTQKVSEIENITDVATFMNTSFDQIDKKIWIKGTVTHVCSHSGRRCFITDPEGKHSIKVEAKGEINGFNRELSGMDIKIRGIVRENRLTTQYIDNWEIELKEDQEDPEEGGEHCASELQNIQQMRDWMKKNNKDYYSIIYIDGLEYEIIYE